MAATTSISQNKNPGLFALYSFALVSGAGPVEPLSPKPFITMDLVPQR